MPRPLEIHIFGGSIGESIVIGLPYGGWGVVDNYTPNLDDPDSSAKVRQLNDTFRHTLTGGTVLMTAGILALSPDNRPR